MLEPGFTHQSYSSKAGQFEVHFHNDDFEPGVFYQWLIAGDTGVCIDQRVNLNRQTWERTVYGDNCQTWVFQSSWTYPVGYGPLTEADANPVEQIVDTQGSYDKGYLEGVDDGYELGYEEGYNTPRVVEPAEMDADLLDAYKYDFPEWVNAQVMQESIFTCGSDIRIDHPFPEDDRMTALWAAHNCKDFDLLLTVFIDAESEANFVGSTGAIAAKDCVYA